MYFGGFLMHGVEEQSVAVSLIMTFKKLISLTGPNVLDRGKDSFSGQQ